MPRTGSGTGLAIHIGADVLASPRYLRWPPSRPCRDTIERMSRLCTAAGIPTQHHLLGVDACVGRVRGALAEAAANLDPSGLLVVTFAGHSERGEPDEQGNRDIGWCLYDGTLPLRETAQLLAAVPATGRVVLVADTCYAAAFARYASSASTLVLLAACAENQ